MSIDYIIRSICDSRIREVILIGDNTTLLDYKHRFMRNLHAADSKAWTQVMLVVIS